MSKICPQKILRAKLCNAAERVAAVAPSTFTEPISRLWYRRKFSEQLSTFRDWMSGKQMFVDKSMFAYLTRLYSWIGLCPPIFVALTEGC